MDSGAPIRTRYPQARLQGHGYGGLYLRCCAALHAKRPQPWNATERPTKRKSAKGKGKSKDGKGAKKLKEGSDRTPDGLGPGGER